VEGTYRLLAELLALAALVAATMHYAIVLRHRQGRRQELRWAAEARVAELWGLVRVMLDEV
jgi:hypothetical protein